MSNFDWLDYDESPVFKQGIAIVRRNGKFGAVMVGGKEIIPPIYDDLSEFKDGYAVAKWNNQERVVNLSGQVRVIKDDEEIFLSDEFDWGEDFVENLCVVVKNGKYGILDANLKLFIPCEYEYIETLFEGLFKFRKGNKWGVIDRSKKLIAEADYINITNETEALLKVESRVQNGSSTESCYGFLDRHGKVIVPAHCRAITRHEQEENIFFITEISKKQIGVIDKNGNLIVPFIYSQISVKGCLLYCNVGDISSVYRFNGEHLLYIENQYVVIPAEYEYAQYIGYGLIQVSKNCYWGLIDITGQIIVETKYVCIDKFNGQFARIGISSKELKNIYLGNHRDNRDSLFSWLFDTHENKNFLYGLIDTRGDVILPIEYEEIEKWDNGYYAVKKDRLWGLLSPTLHVAIEPNKKSLKKLDDKYIVVRGSSEYSTNLQGLIDYYGNEVIPTDGGYYSFSEIEVLENGFLKVIYDKSQYKGSSRIGILNPKGRVVYSNDKCDDITYISNGLLLIKEYDTYNVANFQGKELFNTSYDYIEILENGNFLIHKDGFYGMAKKTGEIFIHPRYTNKIEFENGIAKVQVKGSSEVHYIDTNGQVIVLDSDKNEMRIPKNYYWGTDFINGISIVRTTTYVYDNVYGNDKIGVINEVGEVVIPTKYDDIKLLSDNTLLVYKYNSYGLFDITGKCILPDIFTTLEHINRDKVRVIWNLDKVKSWSFGQYTLGPNKLSSSDVDYIVNNRSALCDTQGNIISDKSLVCIGKFNNGYARCYRNIEVMNNNVVLKQAGIIDINGTIIVTPEYDSIILYHYPYARLRKGIIYGIADLKNRKIRLFDDINIKKAEYVDKFGRLIYMDGDCSNQQKNKGVIGLNGIILPPGKFAQIKLLDDGFIEVSNEDNTLYGLFDLDGKELLKMEYSFISSFMYGYARVRIGGHYEEEKNKFVGGKWGVIDKTGRFIKKCVHDEEQILSIDEIVKYKLIDTSEFDRYGRLLFRDYHYQNFNVGVIGLNRVVVPSGKYTNINLLENGLIEVSNEKRTLYGLLSVEGKELQEMKYSYISAFKNGYASICIGGYNNGFLHEAHIGGKWGVIDDTGKIVLECIYDEEQILTTKNTIERSLANEYGEPIIPILCSDYIPVDASSNIGYDYSDDDGDYDDSPYIDDCPYYNDNLDMDQQSIEFWNSF